MPNGFDIMNLLGQKAEAPTEEAPAAPEASPEAKDCQMCGAMVQHQNPDKTKQAMASMANAFGK